MTEQTEPKPRPVEGEIVKTGSAASVLATIERLAAAGSAINIETMERLYALHERFLAAERENAFRRAFVGAQAEMPRVLERTAVIPDSDGGVSSRFTPFDEVNQIVLPIANRHGLGFGFDVEIKGGVVTVTPIITHHDGHQQRMSSSEVPAMTQTRRMSAAQVAAAQVSMWKRHLTLAFWNIATADEEEEPIDEKQLADLEKLIVETKTNRSKFVVWLGLKDLSELPVRLLEHARAALENKQRPTTDDLKAAVSDKVAERDAASSKACAHPGIAEAVRKGAQKTDEPPPKCSACGVVPTEAELKAMAAAGKQPKEA